MKVDRLGFTPFCLKDPDLDCPEGCRLRGKAATVISNIARDRGVSPQVVIENIRSMDPVTKLEIKDLLYGGMVLAGADRYCENRDIDEPGIKQG